MDDVGLISLGKMYAMTPDPNEFIYAAVLGVPSALLAAAIKFYSDGRGGNAGSSNNDHSK